MIDISLETFRDAAQKIAGKALYTPLVLLPSHTSLHGNPIYLKAESLQPTGAFKMRGATYFLSLHTEEEKKRGVVTYSTGNHAKAVAYAAKLLGVKATIVMSPDAPAFKIAAVKSYGAEVVMTEPLSDVRQQVAEELSRTKGYYLVPPYDHPEIIAGQGTIGLEILEKIDPAAVFVPVGGGGLIAGIAMCIKKMKSSIKIIGVEPELENDGYQSFHSGKLVHLKTPSHSIADAIKVLSLGDMTFPLIQNYVDDMVTVNEAQIRESTLLSFDMAHLLVEPAGALALAAALSYTTPFISTKPVIAIASGGNTTLPYLYNLSKI